MTLAEQPAGIRHDSVGQRFSTVVDGIEAHLDYERNAAMITITHTLVPQPIGGRGIAGQLVQAALEYARGADLKVRPLCSYSDAWMRRHPEYDDLRA